MIVNKIQMIKIGVNNMSFIKIIISKIKKDKRTAIERFSDYSTTLIDLFNTTIVSLKNVNHDIDVEKEVNVATIEALKSDNDKLDSIRNKNQKMIEKFEKLLND